MPLMPDTPKGMEEVLERSNKTIDDILEKKMKIAKFVWKDCKGIAILNITEVGFVFSGAEGDGVLLKHNEDGTWGAPSAIMFSQVSVGAVFGKGHKQVLLFPMSDYAVKMLTADSKFQLGAEIGCAAGPYGAEGSVGADAGGKGIGATWVYAFEDGAFLNIGCNGNFIDAVPTFNKKFYGKDVSSTDIVMKPGSVEIPKGKGVEELHEKLTKAASD